MRDSDSDSCSLQPRHLMTPFSWGKFSHQMKHFCNGLAFLLHDDGMLAPLKTLETGFQGVIFLNHNLVSGCVNWQTDKTL